MHQRKRSTNQVLGPCPLLLLLLLATAIGFGRASRPLGLYVSTERDDRNPGSTTNNDEDDNHNHNHQRSLFYQRYESYPAYCSDPEEMAKRGIPPLPDGKTTESTTYTTKLKRVTAIIRHGSRTPIHSKNCWKGHWDYPDGIWDCELTTLLSTRPPYDDEEREKLQNGGGDDEINKNNINNDRGSFLVEKIYDAFRHESSPSPYRNAMNGTCQAGQLIQQGFDQQTANGKHLRNAYVYEDDDHDNEGGGGSKGDPRLRLFSASTLKNNGVGSGNPRFLDDVMRYRSDDDQRTLASGQVLLSSMFGPEVVAYRNANDGANPIVTHHTADRSNDIMSRRRGNTLCPRQKAVIDRSHQSDEYQSFYHSEEGKTMRRLIDDELEPEGVEFGGLDCIMTSICTDRGLPDAINDYKNTTNKNNNPGDDPNGYTKKYGPDRFERLTNYVVQNRTFISRFNDSELSRLDMGPLWAEILESNQTFALFSAHDSTVYPLMTCLGEKIWNATDFPAYASMMIIEIHEVKHKQTGGAKSHPSEFPSGMAFRLLYNGRVLTWLMEGCPGYSHLCDLSVFMKRVKPFASRKHHGCGVEDTDTGDDILPETSYENKPRAWSESSSFLLLSMALSFVLSGVFTGVVMHCCRCGPRRKQRDESQLVSTEKGFEDEPDIVIDGESSSLEGYGD